ncbi:MAG: dihydroorotase [Gammaproteobacteria bacterium]
MESITFIRPDDWHLHLRDGAALRRTVADAARRFGRAIVMPNLTPPVRDAADAAAYKSRILEACPSGSSFEPLMTLYLTDVTSPADIDAAAGTSDVYAAKLYPAGATTNSEYGVTDIRRIRPALEALRDVDMPLLVHGEVVAPEVDVFDRERVFIEQVLAPLVESLPGLRVVLEHITTSDAVRFVRTSGEHVGATITAHHLILNRNAIFAGGIRPHHYCLPVLKRERHREALLEAATSGESAFFLGTDSAPHARHTKEAACGCAGIYTAHAGIELYAEAFESAGALDRLESFASCFGPAFYGLPVNEDTITLEKLPWTVPEAIEYGEHALVPFRAGEQVGWRIAP